MNDLDDIDIIYVDSENEPAKLTLKISYVSDMGFDDLELIYDKRSKTWSGYERLSKCFTREIIKKLFGNIFE